MVSYGSPFVLVWFARLIFTNRASVPVERNSIFGIPRVVGHASWAGFGGGKPLSRVQGAAAPLRVTLSARVATRRLSRGAVAEPANYPDYPARLSSYQGLIAESVFLARHPAISRNRFSGLVHQEFHG